MSPKKRGILSPLEAMKSRIEKEKLVKEISQIFKESKGYILISLLNLNSETQKKLRNLVKKNNSFFQVIKKKLIYKANPNFPFSDEELKKPFGFIWNFNDDLKVFQVLKEFKKEGIEIDIIKGFISNKVYDKDEVWQIINLPSREEIVAKFIFNLKNPIYRLNNDLKLIIFRLVSILSQIKK